MPVRRIEKTTSAYDFPLLIKHLLGNVLSYTPENEIVYRDQVRMDYYQLVERIQSLGRVLESLGVEQGDTVAVMDWDSHRYLESYFAVPMYGAVLHTINVRLSAEQLIYTINHAEDKVILVHSDFLPLLESVRDQFETVEKIVLIADGGQTRPDTALSLEGEYEELLASLGGAYEFPEFDEEAMATLFYTTGTTGLPKGVYFSHRQLVLHTYSLVNTLSGFRTAFSVDTGDVYMPLTPMFHVHAWGMPYMFTMMGHKQVYPGRYDPEILLKLLVGEGVSFSHCVPTILHMLLNSPVVNDIDLSNWKVVIGGSALPQGLCHSALKYGINVITAYGLSETCPLLTGALLKPHMLDWKPEDQVPYRCRTGVPVPNVNLRVVDPMGDPLPHDGKSTGEVVVRAPWLTQGYFKDPEKSEELWRDGWLHTGDVGFIDELGYLQITDRMKDVIKTGGEWISSLLLEDIISQHEAVSEAAVIGAPDEKWGERPMACVVLREGYKDKVTEEELRSFYHKFVEDGTIAKYGVPDRVMIMDAIPKTSVGKMNKKELRKQQAG